MGFGIWDLGMETDAKLRQTGDIGTTRSRNANGWGFRSLVLSINPIPCITVVVQPRVMVGWLAERCRLAAWPPYPCSVALLVLARGEHHCCG